MTDAAETIPATQPEQSLEIQRRNRRNVLIDAVGVGLATSSGPFLPVFLARLGASSVQVGLLSSMPGLTGLLLSIPIGRFIQTRTNIVSWFSFARLLYLAAYTLTGIVPFFVPQKPAIFVILAIWALATLPQTMLAVTFSVVMNAVAGPEGRYELMSRRWSILGVTTAITVALAGLLLDQITFPLNYQTVFLGLSLGGLVSYYFSMRIQLRDAPQPLNGVRGSLWSNLKNMLGLVRGHPTFTSFTLRRFVYLSGLSLSAPLFPLYFVRELHAADSWIGLVNTAQTIVLLVGYAFWARQSRLRGGRFVLLTTTLAVAFYPGLVALTHSQWLIVVYAAIAGIFQAGMDLVFFDELMKTIPPEYTPTFVSLAQSLGHLSAIIAPLLGTFLAEHIGLSNALIISTVLRLVGFLIFAKPPHLKQVLV